MKLTLDLALTVLAVLTAFLAKHSMTLPKHCLGSRERSFQALWFEKFPWLHYDEGFDVARRYVCYRQSKKNALDSCRNQEDAFIRTGYSNWENALETWKYFRINK